MKKYFLTINIFIVINVFLGNSFAQTKKIGVVVPIKTTRYTKYIPKVGDETLYRYDKVGRLVLSFQADSSGEILPSFFGYDPIGNNIKKVQMLMRKDSAESDLYYLIAFDYETNSYDKSNRLVLTQKHDLNKRLLSEALEEIADLLDQNIKK